MRTNNMQQEAVRGQSQSKVKSYLAGTVFGLIIGIFLLFLSACLFVFSNVPQNTAQIFVYISCGIGALCCGFLSVRKIRKQGLLHGLLGGLLYFIVLFAVGVLTGGEIPLTAGTALQLVVSLAGGALGGILAVNGMKK